MLAAVADEVALPVAFEIEPLRHARAWGGAFPHRRMHGLTPPRDVLRKADVNG
jgi:hypothetical protein